MIRQWAKSIIRKLGYDVVRYYPLDFEKRHIEIIKKVRPYTLTSNERIQAVIESVRYILQNGVRGDFVECGVYKGGSMMAIALTLLSEGVTDRDLYLYDTFEGMPAPSEKDVDILGNPVQVIFNKNKISSVSSKWVNASLDSVKQTMSLTGYPLDRMHFIKGLVEDTIPQQTPESIALLRLDTDLYKSTLHELNHLYPRLSLKGIMIIDDYGHFQGAKDATDEFLKTNRIFPFLHRIDYTGRLIVKP